MKTEIIAFTILRGNVKHYTSTEAKTIEIGKDDFYQNALAYLENYINQHGFKIINATSTEAGMVYFIAKD
jgi:hypothetical protein